MQSACQDQRPTTHGRLPMDLDLATYIRDVPNFPKPGVLFKDITPLLRDSEALSASITALAKPYKRENVSAVAAIESRGFIFAVAVALQLGCGFIPLRKPGKLPAVTTSAQYELEYGFDSIEIHTDAINPNDRIAIIDDLIATGGTAAAAVDLTERLGGKVVGLSFLIELEFLKGRQQLGNHHVHSVIRYTS